jgi:hypothetical protein
LLGREERVFNLGTVHERLTDSTDCAAAMRRPHISTWALRHRDMLHDIAEAAAAPVGVDRKDASSPTTFRLATFWRATSATTEMLD